MPQEDPGRWSVRELRAFLAARNDDSCAHATEKKELADRVRVLQLERDTLASEHASLQATHAEVTAAHDTLKKTFDEEVDGVRDAAVGYKSYHVRWRRPTPHS